MPYPFLVKVICNLIHKLNVLTELPVVVIRFVLAWHFWKKAWWEELETAKNANRRQNWGGQLFGGYTLPCSQGSLLVQLKEPCGIPASTLGQLHTRKHLNSNLQKTFFSNNGNWIKEVEILMVSIDKYRIAWNLKLKKMCWRLRVKIWPWCLPTLLSCIPNFSKPLSWDKSNKI